MTSNHSAPWWDVFGRLRRLDYHVERLMIQLASTKEIVARLKAATDELANDLKAARDKVAEQDSALAAELDPLVARLEEMGSDAKDPVPDAPATGSGSESPAGTGEPFNGPGTGTTPADETADDAPTQSGELSENEVSPEAIPDENR